MCEAAVLLTTLFTLYYDCAWVGPGHFDLISIIALFASCQLANRQQYIRRTNKITQKLNQFCIVRNVIIHLVDHPTTDFNVWIRLKQKHTNQLNVSIKLCIWSDGMYIISIEPMLLKQQFVEVKMRIETTVHFRLPGSPQTLHNFWHWGIKTAITIDCVLPYMLIINQ